MLSLPLRTLSYPLNHMERVGDEALKVERIRNAASRLLRTSPLLGALALVLSCALVLVPCALAAMAPRPNILFVLVDDMGWGDLACFGGVGVPTPNMDGLAREGTRFSQFYVASPICSASRCG